MTRYDDPMFRTSLNLSSIEREQLDLAGELADLEAEMALYDRMCTRRNARAAKACWALGDHVARTFSMTRSSW